DLTPFEVQSQRRMRPRCDPGKAQRESDPEQGKQPEAAARRPDEREHESGDRELDERPADPPQLLATVLATRDQRDPRSAAGVWVRERSADRGPEPLVHDARASSR